MIVKIVKIFVISTMVLTLSSFSTVHSGITKIDGTEFDQVLTTQDTELHLKGAALLRYLYFIEAYAGALYLPEGVDGSQALEDIPKHLVLEYRVDISSEDFAMATRKKIKDAVSSDVYDQLSPKIEIFNQWYRNVSPDDRYALTYIPGKGTTLLHNGESLGTVQGDLFAKALFSIWLGENPIDQRFRDRLLGKL